MLAKPGDLTVVYTTSERFAIELIHSIGQGTTEKFRAKYRNVDVLLIDDVHFLRNKEGTQEELFHTFNELYGNGKQIVLSSDRPPDELHGLQERLVSRFRWGLVADIQPPDLETRIAILREKARRRGLAVDDSVLELIASRITTNVRDLEGALIRAMAYIELGEGPITPQVLEEILPQEEAARRLTVEVIKEEVAARYKVPVAELEGPSQEGDRPGPPDRHLPGPGAHHLLVPRPGSGVRRPGPHHHHALLPKGAGTHPPGALAALGNRKSQGRAPGQVLPMSLEPLLPRPMCAAAESFPQVGGETPVENSATPCGVSPPSGGKPLGNIGRFLDPQRFSTPHATNPQVFHRTFHSPEPTPHPTARGFPQVMCDLYNKDRGYV